MDIAKVLDYGENLKSIFSIHHLVALHNIILNIREVFNLEYLYYIIYIQGVSKKTGISVQGSF